MKVKTNYEKLIIEKKASICALLQNLEEWQTIKEQGCQDPFWADGINMNLVRNHVIYEKRRLLEICEALNEPLPEEYYLSTPPKVADNYLCKHNQYFAERKKRLEQWGNKVTTKLQNMGAAGEMELF